LSTLEAVAGALGVIEGPAVEAELARLFAAVVERTLWSRGSLPIERCTTGIPEAAVRAFHEDGVRGSRAVASAKYPHK
jgi:hypothetical protein